jgi:hypothetical protein
MRHIQIKEERREAEAEERKRGKCSGGKVEAKK